MDEDLLRKREELLARLLAEEGFDLVEDDAIKPRAISVDAPLSFAQQRLWFLNQLEPDDPFYNVQAGVLLTGKISFAALQDTLSEIVRRHEVLRTIIGSSDGRAFQRIVPPSTFRLPIIELSGPSDEDVDAEARRLAGEFARRPFVLAEGPLVRAALLNLGRDRHVLLLNMHHIISDAWSRSIFIGEMAAHSKAFIQGRPSPMMELAIQYADFAIWQREWVKGSRLESQLAYWETQLKGASSLQLPADNPRQAVQRHAGGVELFSIGRTELEGLRRLCSEEGATLFMALLAAFKILIHRYSGQYDIVVGVPAASRNRSEIEGLIGFFVNTLVLRSDLSGIRTFRQLLGRVRQISLDAYANQDVPFEKVVDTLQPERDLSRHPLAQIVFDFHNVKMPELDLPGVVITPLADECLYVKFDLELHLTEEATGLAGALLFDIDLYERVTIQRLLGSFRALIKAIVANPDCGVADLPVLFEGERHQLLQEWNDTYIEYQEPASLTQLILRQVERAPDRVAVVYEGEHISFAELNRRANQVGNYLRMEGVGAEDSVGILMERSTELVPAIVGVLKAGAAYVPLDPDYPVQRLSYMLSDSLVRVVLTQAHLTDRLSNHASNPLSIDIQSEEITRCDDSEPLATIFPDNLAYVIYTSGTTGRPKGAMIPHRGLSNYLKWCTNAYSMHEGRGTVVHSPLVFDLTITSLLAPLMAGQTVTLLPEDDPIGGLIESLRDEGDFTLVKITPAHLDLMSQLLPAERARGATMAFVIGGEALTTGTLEFWRTHSPETRLINEYGPTETVVGCCVFEVPPEGCDSGSIPIGRAIANTQLYVLDSRFGPVATGVQGELCIGGSGVGRGYFGNAIETARSFIPNPFGSEGSRLYRTGDVARHLSDGNLECLGRIDDQVKIRGFRIEPGEIEESLKAHPSVRACVVLPRGDEPGQRRLSAYVVFEQGCVPDIDEIRAFLGQRLPYYMVPSAFVALESLPLTANGKVDRRALPAPGTAQLRKERSYVPPRGALEETLARIWAKTLEVERVGIHDNFFELGGDSILSIQVISRANRDGITLSPKQLFQHPTVEKLAAVAAFNSRPPAEQSLITGPVILAPIQRRFFDRKLQDPHHWNQSLILKVGRQMTMPVLQSAMLTLLDHHDALRTTFVESDGIHTAVQGGKAESASLIWIDLSDVAGNEAASEIEECSTELQSSLDLSTGPLVRVCAFELGEEEPIRLLILIHHLIVDGVSWRILLEDLHTALESLTTGNVPQLSAKTTAFKDWTSRLFEYALKGAFDSEVNYWLDPSRGRICSLPIDFTRGPNTVASSRTLTASLNVDETRLLLHEVPSTYNTQINDALLTALLEAVTAWSKAPSILVDLEGHGREALFDDVDLSRTVGWFTVVSPIQLETRELTDPGELLKSVKEQLRGVPGRGIGYGSLRYFGSDKNVSEELKSMPGAEMCFNYLGQFDNVLPESSLFEWASESIGPTQSPRRIRDYLVDISALVIDGQLRIGWTYSENLHRRSTIEQLAHSFIASLRSIIAHCLLPASGGYTVSDFPGLDLDQEQLDNILQEIDLSPRGR